MTVSIDPEFIHSRDAIIIAIVFASAASLVSMIHVLRHLMNFTMPGIQVYVVRILLIVPIYSISSALALSLGENGMYAESIRDIYEAVVIYTFLNLMLEFCGGETVIFEVLISVLISHTGEKPFQCCQYCVKTFADRGILNK